MFMYAMNDWRSSFFGANDHEADLEQAMIVLEAGATDADAVPRWIGCAAHDYVGDDLRRRWDDPTLTFVDGHPVIFAGAGSHASYFERGEYVTPVPLPALRFLRSGLEGFRRLWRDVLRQDDPGDLADKLSSALSIPFIDYARGDGLRCRPRRRRRLDASSRRRHSTPWIDGFRGLWGLDTRDRFAGERAPAGPKYTRKATVRQSWNDPLGFLGLDKLPPPGLMPTVLRERITELEAERAAGRVAAELKAGEVRRTAAATPVRAADIVEVTGPTKEELALGVAESELAELAQGRRDPLRPDRGGAARPGARRGGRSRATRGRISATTSARNRPRSSATGARSSSGPRSAPVSW